MGNNLKHISGDESKFAIITTIEKEYSGVWMVGELHYIINNNFLGKPELCSLRDAMYISESILSCSEARNNEYLYNMDDYEVFNLIKDGMYEGREDIYTYLEERVFPGNFDININVESMIDDVIFSVSKKNRESKVLYKYRDNFHVEVFDYGLVDSVVEDTHKFLSNFHEREVLLCK
ncbi:Imm42 family immunity protein [Asaia sp. VD9]|uniref:Imm42 family immunity protein n=1 Tax=Asaia sp. VD9 TaxID=3081235 RepID=UPI0030192697